jgi:hypothetical protein
MKLGSVCQLNPDAWLNAGTAPALHRRYQLTELSGVVGAFMERQVCWESRRATCRSTLFLAHNHGAKHGDPGWAGWVHAGPQKVCSGRGTGCLCLVSVLLGWSVGVLDVSIRPVAFIRHGNVD